MSDAIPDPRERPLPPRPKDRGRVEQISVNPKGGVPKYAVRSAEIHAEGVRGDLQRNLKHHGGPLRAVSLFSLEKIELLRAEGHPISPGTVGENLTLSGLDWDALQPGDRLRIGPVVVLELTSHVVPCHLIGESFVDRDFTRISQRLHPGDARLYAKVLAEGTLHAGDEVLVEHVQPELPLDLSAAPARNG